MTLIPTPRRPYDDPCSSRVNFWTEMPREGASLGAQTMPDNCQFLQGRKRRRAKWAGNRESANHDLRRVSHSANEQPVLPPEVKSLAQTQRP